MNFISAFQTYEIFVNIEIFEKYWYQIEIPDLTCQSWRKANKDKSILIKSNSSYSKSRNICRFVPKIGHHVNVILNPCETCLNRNVKNWNVSQHRWCFHWNHVKFNRITDILYQRGKNLRRMVNESYREGKVRGSRMKRFNQYPPSVRIKIQRTVKNSKWRVESIESFGEIR